MGRPLSQRYWQKELYSDGGYNIVLPYAWLDGMSYYSPAYITRQLSVTRFQLEIAWGGYAGLRGEAELVNYYPQGVGQCAIGLYQYILDGDEGFYGYVQELNDNTAVTFAEPYGGEGGYGIYDEASTPWQISSYSSNNQDPNYGSYIWTNAYNLN